MRCGASLKPSPRLVDIPVLAIISRVTAAAVNRTPILGGITNLELAVTHYKEASAIRTAVVRPRLHDVATTLNNLVGALEVLGGTTNLEQAVTHYKDASAITMAIFGQLATMLNDQSKQRRLGRDTINSLHSFCC